MDIVIVQVAKVAVAEENANGPEKRSMLMEGMR